MNQQPLLQTPRNAYPPDFEQVWQAYPRRGKTKGSNDNKIAAARAYQQRIRQGHSPQEIAQGVEQYAAYIRAQGQEGTPYVKQCATFLGPDCHFLCEWEAPQAAKGADAWQRALEAASRSRDDQRRFVADNPELEAAIQAVGGIKQLGLMNEWQLKEAKTKFMDAISA